MYRIPRIDVNGVKIFEVGEKCYFEDLGLRNVLRTFDFKNDINPDYALEISKGYLKTFE